METTQPRQRVRAVIERDAGDLVGVWREDADPQAILSAVLDFVTAEDQLTAHGVSFGPFAVVWSFDSTELIVHADGDEPGVQPWSTFDVREVEVQ